MPNPGTLRVAIVQARPALLDLETTLDRTVALVAEAAAGGARLVVFGESWLPGYPVWLDYCRDVALWDNEPAKSVFARLRQNSITVPGAVTETLSAAARAHNTVLVVGIHERVDAGPGSGTLYNSLLTFDADGALANHHRKLIPTYTERLVWGQGDARGLRSVDTAAGRVGGLICWEHWMPLARQALHDSGEAIHVAAWPNVHEMLQIASRGYAFEGRCFVLAAGSIVSSCDLPEELGPPTVEGNLLRGGSAIIGPDGRYVVEPVYDDERVIVTDLDLEAIDRERMTLDVSGHYSRPDLFSFSVK